MERTTKVYRLNTPQRLFVGYTLAVLVDLTVLNFYAEHWDYVSINSFTISFAAAILLQLLLKLSMKAEQKVAEFFSSKPGKAAKLYRGLITLVILIGSKFVMLEAIDLMFAEKVEFSGPLNGLIAFIAVIITIIVTERIIGKIYFALDDTDKKNARDEP